MVCCCRYRALPDDESWNQEAEMKLFVPAVVVISLLISRGAFAKAGDPSASDAPHGSSQAPRTIVITRSGEHTPAKAPAEHFTGSASVDRFLTETAASHTSGAIVAFEAGLAQPGIVTRWVKH